MNDLRDNMICTVCKDCFGFGCKMVHNKYVPKAVLCQTCRGTRVEPEKKELKFEWEEKRPVEGDIVKIQFSNNTGLCSQIGICLGYYVGRLRVCFGSVQRLLPIDNYEVFTRVQGT